MIRKWVFFQKKNSLLLLINLIYLKIELFLAAVPIPSIRDRPPPPRRFFKNDLFLFIVYFLKNIYISQYCRIRQPGNQQIRIDFLPLFCLNIYHFVAEIEPGEIVSEEGKI